MLTWGVMIALAIGVYAQRAAGALLVDTDRVNESWRRVLDALPLAIISAVIALSAFTSDGKLGFDARVFGLGAAAICAWRRMPMMVIVLAAAATTALIRQFT